MVHGTAWPRALRWLLGIFLAIEWIATAFVLWIAVSFSCLLGAPETQDSLTNHPLGIAVLIWLPVTIATLVAQANLPRYAEVVP